MKSETVQKSNRLVGQRKENNHGRRKCKQLVSPRLFSCSHSQEGVQCLLEQSLVKLSREQSRSLVDVMLSQRSDADSTSLPWSSPLDVEAGRSSFRGILGYSCGWDVGYQQKATFCNTLSNSTWIFYYFTETGLEFKWKVWKCKNKEMNPTMT